MLKCIRLNFTISSEVNTPNSPLMPETLYHHIIFHLQLLLQFAHGGNFKQGCSDREILADD